MSRPNKLSQEKVRHFFYVRKDTIKEYSLMKMELKGSQIVQDLVLHRDIPAIIYSKLFQLLKIQEFENG